MHADLPARACALSTQCGEAFTRRARSSLSVQVLRVPSPCVRARTQSTAYPKSVRRAGDAEVLLRVLRHFVDAFLRPWTQAAPLRSKAHHEFH